VLRHLIGTICVILFLPQSEARVFNSAPKDSGVKSVPFVLDVTDQSTEDAPRTEMNALDEGGSDTEASDSTFSQVTDKDTPVSLEEVAGEKSLTQSRPWKAPDFSRQSQALGYSPEAFSVPPGLELNYKFWLDVYSKYNTDQGVLHDSEYIDLVYEEIDFTAISSRTDINKFQKERLKTKLVKDSKKKILNMLAYLGSVKIPESLTGQEKRIWDYFDKIKNPKKFKLAREEGRLRFQLGQRDRVIQGIYFSGRYLEDFETIFREAGLPIELVRLPFVESSYNVLARSKVGASGLWQIMPYTAKGFMKKDPAVDLRNHPIEATKLAAKLLRGNYKMLQSWPLAVTGYNHGPSGVLKLTKKWKTRELGGLSVPGGGKGRLGFASRNFYPSFLAVLEVTSHASKYLGAVTWSMPLDSVDLKLPIDIKYKDLVRWFELDDIKTQVFNPHITKIARARARPIPRGMVVSIPRAKRELVMKELESPESLRKAQAAAEAEGRMPSGELIEPPLRYVIQRGDTLRSLSQDFGAPIEEIRKLNKLPKKGRLRPGRVIHIP
jgi:membrane-bound lytic murein transglycosylase D